MFVSFAFIISEKYEDKINRVHCSELSYLLSSAHIPAVTLAQCFSEGGPCFGVNRGALRS